MRVLVLGERGMLGHAAVHRFAELGHDVATVQERFDPYAPLAFLEAVASVPADVVVNGIGLIKQKCADIEALFAVNAFMPALLRARLSVRTLLVQPSTDCVFNGSRGWRHRDERPDAVDAYGRSKAMGEGVAAIPNTLVVRTSIVGFGTPGSGGHGLLAWFLGHPLNATVPGFTDHLWNGLTSLEWCDTVAELLRGWFEGNQIPSVIQPGVSRAWTKAEVLQVFRDVLRPDLRIELVRSEAPVDRTLRPDTVRGDFRAQMERLADWHSAHGQGILSPH